MRNLKKVLSLALALVMLLGMMMVGAGAATTTSADLSEANQEAIAVLKATKVMTNKRYGDPVTRAEAAKMVLTIFNPTLAKGVKNTQNSAYFKDVKNHWAAGYIDLCFSEGIVSGRTKNVFDPNGSVTGYELAKMVMVAMGKTTKYTGSTWTSKVMQDVIGLNLNADTKISNWNAPVTRLQAAQLTFNGMITPVDGQKEVFVVTAKDGTELYRGDDAITASVIKSMNADSKIDRVSDTTGTLAANFGLKKDPKTDAFGHMSTVWKMGVKEICAVANGTQTAVKTYTNGVAPGTVARDFNGYNVDVKKAGYIKNGNAEAGKATDASSLTNFAAIEAKIGNGKIVEVYATNNVIDKVIEIEKSVAKLNADPVVKDGKVSISELGIVAADVKKVVGYDTIGKGDVVLYVGNGKGDFMVEPAEKITAPVTGYTSGGYATGKALINGAYYDKSALTGSGKNYLAAITDTKTYDIWLDNGGNIVATAVAGTGETQTAQLAVVQDLRWVVPSSDGSFGSVSNAYVQARLVFMDGTSQIVTVGSIDGVRFVAKDTDLSTLGGTHYNKVTDTRANGIALVGANLSSGTAVGSDKVVAKNYFALADGDSAKAKAVYYGVSGSDDLSAATVGAFTKGNFYNFTESNGVYTLTSLTATQGTNTALSGGASPDKKIENNKPLFNEGVVASGIANSNTVFIYATADALGNYSFQSYTGIANVPTTAANVGGYSVKTTSGLATYVYADLGTNGTSTASQDLVFVYDVSDFVTVNGNPSYTQGTVMLNGVPTVLKMKSAPAAGELRTVKGIDNNGIYELDTAMSPATGIKAVSGGVLVVGTNTSYTYAANAVAYVLDGKTVSTTTIGALTLDANDKITVVANSAGEALAAYVQKVKQNPATVTVATATDSSNSVTVPNDGTEAMATSGKTTVTGWTAAKCKVNFTLAAATGTKIKSIAVNGSVLPDSQVTGEASGATPANLTAAADVVLVEGANTITIIVTDDNGGPDAVFTYTVTATKA